MLGVWVPDRSVESSAAGCFGSILPPGTAVDPKGRTEQKPQLGHHFELGNASGADVPTQVYRQSTTMVDYPLQKMERVEANMQDRTVNWPDMAPRYMAGNKTWESEYMNTFAPQSMSNPRPLYPKVDTSKLKLPLDAEKFWHQRGTNMQLGSHSGKSTSEHHRAYDARALGGKRYGSGSWEAGVTRGLKEQSKVSHVFRGGDYDNIVGAFETTCNEAYGPRAMARGDQLVDTRGVDDRCPDSALTLHARQTIVPGTMQDARDGLKYQTKAHFELGTDTGKLSSIYSKDFHISPLKSAGLPVRHGAQPVAEVLQNDPAYAPFGRSCTSTEFSGKTDLSKLDPNEETVQRILRRGHKNSVVFSDDNSRHIVDRQQSLCHTDYQAPPPTKPREPLPRHGVDFDYLTPNDALPFPPSDHKESEAKNNYSDTFMKPSQSLGRRRLQMSQCRERMMDGKSAHFISGYWSRNYGTEMRSSYTGRPTSDQGTPTAGIMTVPNTKFPHFYISQNTQDLRAADPHVPSKHESLMAREAHEARPNISAYTSTVTSSDFNPLKKREFTSDDVRMIDSCEKRGQKPIALSHYFHTDNSGSNQYQSTQMNDYMKPEIVTGRKLLSAL
ncbi:hypothetical protein ScPMuIL_013580 [Solemya velum]